MDGRRFDAWTKALTGSSSRRTVMRRVVGGAATSTLALLRGGTAAAADAGNDATCRCAFAGDRFCQSEKCEFDEQCCSRKCVSFNRSQEQGGEECSGKRCLCRFSGARCAKDCACCSGRCQRNGRCA